ASGIASLWALCGQFGVVVVSTEINAQLRSMQAVNAAASNELAAHLERGEKPTAESLSGLRKRDPAWNRRQVCAWYADKPLPLCTEFQGTSLTLPTFIKGRFQDIVRDHDELHLRVGSSLSVGSNKLTVVTSEPFDKDLVGKIAADLGEITLYTAGPSDRGKAQNPGATPNPSEPRKSSIVITSDKQGAARGEHEDFQQAFTVGQIPEPAGSFDREITFGT